MTVIKTENFRPLRDTVFVKDLDRGARKTSGGIILVDDDMKTTGIRERWGCVCALGPEIDELKIGDWILIQHARWTNGIDLEINGEVVRVWRVDYPEAVLMAADTDPRDSRYVR